MPGVLAERLLEPVEGAERAFALTNAIGFGARCVLIDEAAVGSSKGELDRCSSRLKKSFLFSRTALCQRFALVAAAGGASAEVGTPLLSPDKRGCSPGAEAGFQAVPRGIEEDGALSAGGGGMLDAMVGGGGMLGVIVGGGGILGAIVGGGGCQVVHVDFKFDDLEDVNLGAELAKEVCAARGGGGGASDALGGGGGGG